MIFVRGDWCPSCHIMLRTYQRHKEKFTNKNITIMAIGPDPVGVNREMVESLNVDYKILSDESLECSSKYGIKKAPNNPMTKYEEGIPLPASFLVCQEGVLRYTSRADKPGEILNPAEIFSVIDKLN
jgi:peroxiredoxin